MTRGMGRRLLSLALAAELLCTPLAMARAEDPARIREETPMGEEARPVRTPAEDRPVSDIPTTREPDTVDITVDSADRDQSAQTPAQGSQSAQTPAASGAGSGREEAVTDISAAELMGEVMTNANYIALGFSYGQGVAANKITCYNGYLQQEYEEDTYPGYVKGNITRSTQYLVVADDQAYFYLPEMGRIPDLELEGIYFNLAALEQDTNSAADPYASWIDDPNQMLNWRYDESQPSNYVKINYTPVPAGEEPNYHGVTLLGSGTLVRFPASQLTTDMAAQHSNSSRLYWNVPMVARWVPSDESDISMFTLDVKTDTGSGLQSQSVTDLYTKPFRQAGSGDHLTAHSWTSAEHLRQSEPDGSTTAVTRTANAFTPPATDGTGESQHYYLRVTEETESITLRFLTREPNYKHHIGNPAEGEEGHTPCPVSVSASFAGAPQDVDLGATLTVGWDDDGQPFFPQSVIYGSTAVAQNSLNLPARGQWTVADVPLKKVSEASDAESDPFNTITVTVTAPDGTTESTYVFHVERLMTALATAGTGNTPAGMIMRDDSSDWTKTDLDWDGYAAGGMTPTTSAAWVEFNKASALNYFKDKRDLVDMPIQLTGEVNQKGAIYRGTYDQRAWTTASTPDNDPTAVVAYLDTAFDDPGVSFIDSEGREVKFGDTATGAYKTCVTRTLELRTAPALTVDTYGTDGERCWYNVDGDGRPVLYTPAQVNADLSLKDQVLRKADGTDPIDLRGRIVLPGIYTATYTFSDPVSLDVKTIQRTIVILPTPGDVDMDGAVTIADAMALDLNATAWSTNPSPVFRLIRNRVYNMSRGNGVGSITAAEIRAGFQPVLGAGETTTYSDYPYIPLPYTAPAGDTYHTRKTWSEITPLNANGAKLELRYLGTEGGTWNKGTGEVYTNNITGPWNSEAKGVSIVPGSPDAGTGDVFWMGVYVGDPGAMGGRKIKELSVSLIYDSEYVTPALVYPMNEGKRYSNETTRWHYTTLYEYNMGPGSSAGSIFTNRDAGDYDFTGSVMARPYATHYSKVEGDLEQAYTDTTGLLDSSKLKEVVISMRGIGELSAMREGCLLALPFKMVRHPDERMTGTEAQLIELAAGMRDFNIVFEQGTGRSASNGIFELFSVEPRVMPGSTYAFSAQDDIFGNSTQNIRETLTFSASESLVPIGKDNTVRILLTDSGKNNAVYDEPFTITNNAFNGGTVTAGALPPGLELDPAAAQIRGVPTQVRRDENRNVIGYDFTIKGQPYRIIVEPKTIHYRSKAIESYYGESELRGEDADRLPGQRNYTFTYDRVDLSKRDQEAAKAMYSGWTGTGSTQGTAEELEAILTRGSEAGVYYTPPKFQAQSGGRTVTATTRVGKYEIVTENQPAATNYELVYYDASVNGALNIIRRPVWLSHIVMSAEDSAVSIYNDDNGRPTDKAVEETATKQYLHLAFDDTESAHMHIDTNGDRFYDGLPLTGDARVGSDTLNIKVMLEFVPNQDDLDYIDQQMQDNGAVSYRFLVTESTEERSLRVTKVDSEQGGFYGDYADNYLLMGSGNMLDPDQCAIFGTVILRGVKGIKFTGYPLELEYDENGEPKQIATYGDPINHEELFVQIILGADGVDGKDEVIPRQYQYNNPMLLPMEVHYNWVSEEMYLEGSKEEHKNDLVGTNWDPTKPAGEQDLFPYEGTTTLTCDMDKHYLCASVRMYEADPSGGTKYVKAYSEHPIRVVKKTITLTAQPTSRFYGEDNETLAYVYDSSELTYEDQNALDAWVVRDTGRADAMPTYTGEEMVRFFQEVLRDPGFQAPTIETSTEYSMRMVDGTLTSVGQTVTKATPVGSGEFYVLLYGAKATNYAFAYKRPKVVDRQLTSQTETVSGESAYSFNRMMMYKRPIVVSDIYSDADKGKANFQTIYADTKNLFLTGEQADAQRVNFTLPAANGYYRYGVTGFTSPLPASYGSREALASHVNDQGEKQYDDVSVRYSVRFMCDPGCHAWYAFDHNYYDIATLSDPSLPVPGTMQKDVVVADMELVGADAINYELVYNKSENAAQRAPDGSTVKYYPNPANGGLNTRYLIHGTGTVTLRKIKELVLESVGQAQYNYGDKYAPDNANAATGTAMTVMVKYDTAIDEAHDNDDLKNNVNSEPVEYKYDNRNQVSTFSQRGFTIYYLKAGQTQDEAIQAGQTLEKGITMLPTVHDGARLFVTGQRRLGDEVVHTATNTASPLRVSAGALTFTVRDAHRYYGETLHLNAGEEKTDTYFGTTGFTYTFPTEQLALRDREKLAQLKGVDVDRLPAVSTEADLKLLEASGWSMGLVDPAYSGDPGARGEINKNSWGEYTITMTPRDMTNYKVTGQPGTLYVYPRPVRVTGVTSAQDSPVITIYNQSSTLNFDTEMDTNGRVVVGRANVTTSGSGYVIDNKTNWQTCSDNVSRELWLSGNGLVGDDALTFTVKLSFDKDDGWDLSTGVADYAMDKVLAIFRNVKTTANSKNYTVTNISSNEQNTVKIPGLWGAVKLRTIDDIFITRLPNKPLDSYVYGEELDLSGLQVTIRYKSLSGQGGTDTVDYVGANDFKNRGLYINYWYGQPGDRTWTPASAVPGGQKVSHVYNSNNEAYKDATTTTELEDQLRQALPETYRRADTGDHLTIAPTHDTQRYIGGSSTDPKEWAFSANGAYLIVSAYQEGNDQAPAVPKIIGGKITNVNVEGGSYEDINNPTPIRVRPKQITYTLSAQDKIYDGTTQAAGTLTLTNLFDAMAQEETRYSGSGYDGTITQVRDMVYIPMGEGYEVDVAQYPDHNATVYNALRAKMRNGVVSFNTGSYRANGQPPLSGNEEIEWNPVYTWGRGLTFTFANPNVHYLEGDETTPRALDRNDLDYWYTAQAHNAVTDQWDFYNPVCAMPVDVTNMVLTGPDAANYTWASDGTALKTINVTIGTWASPVSGQESVTPPTATIHKANRATIQALAGESMALPYLQLDEHTNVVRLFYDQDLTVLGDNHNAAGADEFRDELHFEYALFYDKDGLMTHWAGPRGNRAYQDTMFFGGEILAFQDDAIANYVPDYENMNKQVDADPEKIVYKGQRYRWADEDTGVSVRVDPTTGQSVPGYREDAGVIRDLAAYPGDPEEAEQYYTWYYDLYNWGPEGMARAALPRDTVFYPLVRLSETHNYYPSGVITGDAVNNDTGAAVPDGRSDVSPEDLDAAQKLVAALTGDPSQETAAQTASAKVFAAAAGMDQAARKLSQDRVDYDADLSEQSKYPDEGRPLIGSAPAVKTFLQRLDLVSVARERSADRADDTEYIVKTLEAVWFTDTLKYPDIKNMNAVVYNSPVRYYNYYWDIDESAAIKFMDKDTEIDFGTTMTAAIRRRLPDGTMVDDIFVYDPTDHTALIYVQVVLSGGRTLRSMEIAPAALHARLGDAPYPLRLVLNPAMPTSRRFAWTTSDPSVATVDQEGVVTFRGEGTAIITVTSSNGLTATCVVTVSAVLPVNEMTSTLFNFGYKGPWAMLDDSYAFRPKLGMTRGELVTLLDLFLNPSEQWKATQELAYIDVTGREKYYDALRRLTGVGVITGIPGSCFAGDHLATRAEFVAMLSRMLQLNVVDTKGQPHAFVDTGEEDTWAYAYIDALAKTGVIRGVGNGEFAPNRIITREETAAIIARLLTAQVDAQRTDLLRPSDMTPENWSYVSVLRAINTILFRR